ncbi:MAG: pentapeptide repeat-containing protein [Acidobacteriaceae bacterium]|nr:pentapeptide repeat-containing protein [Acidobacteriaceae bacterium]
MRVDLELFDGIKDTIVRFSGPQGADFNVDTLREKVYSEIVPVSTGEISPYVFIFDGWDEINLSADEGFQKRVDRLLGSIRRNLTDQNRTTVRVIITGRPSAAIDRSGVLREQTKVLLTRAVHPTALRNYVQRLKDALDPPQFDGDAIQSWTLGAVERYEPLLSRYEKEFPNVGTLQVLGQPLLAHLAMRVMASLPDDIEAVVASPTSLYRHLTDLTCKRGGKPPNAAQASRASTRLEGENLRSLLHGVALSITAHGTEAIPEDELQLRLESLGIGDLHALESDEYPLSRLMVSFYFKQAGEHSACEFLHKSFREYLTAEAVVEVLKQYARRCNETSPPEKASNDYWRDFAAEDPRYWLTRKLGEMLSAQWLTTPVLNHILELLRWEVGRYRKDRDERDRHLSGVPTRPLSPAGWMCIRDALADLWDWWGEGVHLRAQPELKQKTWNLDQPPFVSELCKLATRRVNYKRPTPPPTKRTATIDAQLGAALFQLCAAVHWFISVDKAWLNAVKDVGPRNLWANVSPGPRRYQATVVHGEVKFIQFAPTGRSRYYFRNYAQRIAGSGVGKFPEFTFMPGACFRGAGLSDLRFISTEMFSCCLDDAYMGYCDFTRCDLESASLYDANLFATGLFQTNLDGADLTEANLYSANLRTNLDKVLGLTQIQLATTGEGYKATLLPQNLKVPSHWQTKSPKVSLPVNAINVYFDIPPGPAKTDPPEINWFEDDESSEAD